MQAHSETASYPNQNRTSARLVIWTLAWLATLAAARFGPQFVWDAQQQPVASWAAVAANVLVGVVWIFAFARFLRALDDLGRKIMLDALAVTLGVGWVVGFGYFVADAADLVAFELNTAIFPALLGIVYLVAFMVGRVRYR
jgi:hypothetical protein